MTAREKKKKARRCRLMQSVVRGASLAPFQAKKVMASRIVTSIAKQGPETRRISIGMQAHSMSNHHYANLHRCGRRRR